MAAPAQGRPRAAAVLFDRDGTLVEDVPYNADPDRVSTMPGAAVALRRLRAHGVRTGVITNQSGVARGLITPAALDRVNRRVEALLGPFDVWQVCVHGPDDGCGCRKPAPGMVVAAACRLGVAPRRCVVVGDIGSDMDAARAAGADAVLVPTPVTLREEVERAPRVAADLAEVVDWVLGGRG
jgi:histidinol-phosphate phosphatase family protein